ncbi:MAG TPA: hypothetical protein VMX17_03440 [Candidatus Glassbacteria bacterium]|nr:hypothetical protein [Candidatus Glassbacteria bacterium]
MKVSFERLVGPEYMYAAMRATRGKDMTVKKMPSLEIWQKMILSEHSSPRAVKYRIYIEEIPYYAHVHLIRHNIGVEPHVRSQRDDNGKEEVTFRDDTSQGAPISMILDVNVQALINIARKRLCYKAHRQVQDFVEKLKCALIYNGDDYDKVLGKLLMRPCSWFPGYCSELKPCGRIPDVRSLHEIHVKALEGLK